MPKSSLEDRMTRLERQMAQLLAEGDSSRATEQPAPDAWKSVIGYFKKGDGMKEVFDEALKIREKHREEFHKKQSRRRPVAKRRKVS